MAEPGRHGIIGPAIAHQRQGTDPPGALVTGIIGRCWKWLKNSPITLQPLADRLTMTPQPFSPSLAAARFEMGVQAVEGLEPWHRHQEVPAAIADETFHLTLVVAFTRTPEAILEQIVGPQLTEHPCPLAPAVTEDTGHRDLRVVIENRTRHAAEKRDPRDMPIAECFCRLTRIGLHKACVRVRQAHRQEVDLALEILLGCLTSAPYWTTRPWPHNLNQMASDNPGEVQLGPK